MKNPSRRQVLRGLGGFTLALPFLPSLLVSKRAEAAGFARKRFVQFTTQHGGVWGTNMYPADSTLTTTLPYVNRTVRSGPLGLATASGNNSLSAVLTAPSASLSPAMAAKMNLLRGVDIPYFIGHHTGGHLGNFARNDGNAAEGVLLQKHPTATIDQVMAWSPSFYADIATSNVTTRSFSIGGNISWGWSDPTTKSGKIQPLSATLDAVALFNSIFLQNGWGPQSVSQPVVDLVFADYQRLRTSNTRLSGADRVRLDDHMQRLSELQRRLDVHVTCSSTAPASTNALRGQASYSVTPATQAEVYGLLNDVIVAAITCDASRVATVGVYDFFSSYAGDWHQDIAHQAFLASPGTAQTTQVLAHQAAFKGTFLDLATKLDVDDGSGKTYLDNSLVVWTHEHGEFTHDGQGMPIVTAGSAGGFLKTGLYCDYRDTTKVLDGGLAGSPTTTRVSPGLIWHQWLGTALQAMGLPRTEYESNGVVGYPAVNFAGQYAAKYPSSVWSVAGDILPFVKA